MRAITVCAVLMGIAGGALADDAAPPADAAAVVFPQGWYVAPMFSYSRIDNARRAGSNGVGGMLTLGNRSEIASLEIAGIYSGMADSATLEGGELELLVGPFFSQQILARFFGVIGFGMTSEQKVPGELKDRSSNIIGDGGIGYMHPLEAWGWKFNIRSELRYRYDYQQPPQPAGSPGTFKDWVVNVGLQVPLSTPATLPPPAPAPVTVVQPVAEPAPAPAPAPEPAKPVEPATTVTPDAAPVTIETAKAGDTVVLSGVTFDTGKATLQSTAKTVLEGVAKQLMARPGLKVEIGGHTDSKGKPKMNQKLSEARAESVKNYLVEQGVNPDQLTSVGYGQNVPVDTNDTPEGREKNRRVEMKILDSGAAAAPQKQP